MVVSLRFSFVFLTFATISHKSGTRKMMIFLWFSYTMDDSSSVSNAQNVKKTCGKTIDFWSTKSVKMYQIVKKTKKNLSETTM